MDISFRVENEKFNYRVAAVILSDGKILAMKDDRSPFYYLPGGRVSLGETAEGAVLRELEEELGIRASIARPLWLNQAFFEEEVCKLHYHELALYFLIDISNTDLLARGESFESHEGGRTHVFTWLRFEELEEAYFYPLFLKKEIFNLPTEFTLRIETE